VGFESGDYVKFEIKDDKTGAAEAPNLCSEVIFPVGERPKHFCSHQQRGLFLDG
jgi:hypothetical protein